MLLSSWWFWIIVIAIIGLVIGIILFFATDFNRLIVYGLLGVFILLLILGIFFAIRSYRKPKQRNFGDRFIPGFSEGRAIAGKTGLTDLRRQAMGSTSRALGSAGRAVGSTAKSAYGNRRLREILKKGITSGPDPLLWAVNIAGSEKRAEKNRRNELKNKQTNLELQQAEQQIQQQQQQLMNGGMPQQQMGGMPQQQMGGMPQQQMGGMPQQQMIPQY